MIEFRAPTEADIVDLGQRMRAQDAEECRIGAGLMPEQALRESVRTSDWACAFAADGVTMAIFGVCSDGMFSAAPWMLSAHGIEKHARTIVREAPRFVGEMRRSGQALSNVVHADNRAAIRFIRWCGFKLGDAIVIEGEPFVCFHAEAA